MENIYENLVFTGMDFVNEPKRMLEEIESKICYGMTSDEFKAYKYGVQVVFDLIDNIVNQSQDDMFVHIDGLEHQEEFVLEELLDKIGY